MIKSQYKHAAPKEQMATVFRKIYSWMFIGLLISALASYFAITTNLLAYIISNSFIFIGIIILELAVVFIISGMIKKLEPSTARILFILYSLLNGLTLAVIFLVYTMESIFYTFIVSAIMFGSLAFYGFITKKDLSGMGSILMMGLIGIIVASIFNIFIQSQGLFLIITIFGILIFCGLTAYDNYLIKKTLGSMYMKEDDIERYSIVFALKLYLDFINLFLILLRLLGKRRE